MAPTRGFSSRLLILGAVGALLLAACAPVPPPPAPPLQPAGRVAFESENLPLGQLPTLHDFSTGTVGTPTVISGELVLPPGVTGRVPAVILLPTCSGVGGPETAWASELAGWGRASFVVDPYSGRGIREVCSGAARINSGSLIIDAYRALEWLASHPRIDPDRVALMGFSLGGRIAIWASLTRFQRLWLGGGRPFAAYLGAYPASCYITLIGEEDARGGPIRIFHGTRDAVVPVERCRDYAVRMRRAGRDVQIHEYAGAGHAFDDRRYPGVRWTSNPLNPFRCQFLEQPDGRFVDREGHAASQDHPCVTRGYPRGYDARAHRQMSEDVRGFLSAVLRAER